jgi:ribosomal protein L15
MADEKLSLSLDDIITKNKKPDRPAKAAGGAGRGPRRGAAKSDGPGPAGGNKARALAVAVGKATKRTGAAPRRNSGGAPQRRVEVVELAEVRAICCSMM